MLFGFLGVLVLAGALFVVRSGVGRGVPLTAWSNSATRREKIVAAGLVVASALPLLELLPWLGPSTHFGDAVSHAHVARDIARHGLPHGWVDTYLGGFPFGLHYPPLGTLLLALGVWIGLPSAEGTQLWGLILTLGAPLAMHVAALRAGARPTFAAAGALFVAWVSPYNPFVGGYEAFFQVGLFAQVLALPICIVFAGLVARGDDRWPAPVAALAMAAHPQLTVATLGVVGLASAVCLQKDVLFRFARGAAGALLFGVALYGQGVLTLDIPFGWPPELGWRLLGFGWSRLDWWLFDGDLVDRGRSVPALTALAGTSALVLACRARRPAARAGLAALFFVFLLSGIGPALLRFEPIGPALLTVLQPLRALALVPPICGALVVIALEESAPLLGAALIRLGRPQAASVVARLELLVALAVLALALPNRTRYAADRALQIARRASGHCAGAPAGYRRDVVRNWLAELRRGRLWFHDHPDDTLQPCLVADGIALESAMPLAITGGGPGAHVGIHWLAFHQLEPVRSGSDLRAEALGVRHLLVSGPTPHGWEETRRSGKVALFSHAGPTDLVGAGCIVERRRGSDKGLRERLVEEFKTSAGTDRLLDPVRFVALEHGGGEPTTRTVDPAPCDPKSARVRTTPREPGALEAVVETETPVDVVFRAAAFPTWKVSIDGKPAERIERVAPGFFSVRVSAGRHHLIAVVSPMPGYLFWIALGALAVVATSVLRPEHLRKLVIRRATGT